MAKEGVSQNHPLSAEPGLPPQFFGDISGILGNFRGIFVLNYNQELDLA